MTEPTTAIDPICGMTVDRSTPLQSTRGDETFYFCNPHCKTRFDANTPSPAPPDHRPGAEYTCPMHPDVVRDGPGACPICGMALEPRVVTLDDAPNHELIDMQRRFVSSAVLTLPLLASMFLMIPPLAQLALATPVVLWGGLPFFQRGWRHLNMFTLISLGTGVSFIYSAINALRGVETLYFEPAAVITTLVLLGQILELRAREKTSHAVRALLGLAPKSARVIRDDGSEHDMPIEQIKPGMKLRVRPGERVAVDGIVLEGQATIDESMITGEPMPVEKTIDNKLTAGTVSTSGTLVMRAERVGSDTLLAQIVRMVGEAQRSRAPIQRLADVVSAWFVPAVIAVALITFFVSHSLANAVAVVIIACPCALGLATPMSVMVATGRGATAGILIRNAEQLETLSKVDVVVIDKTGTLTEGKPRVVSVETMSGFDEREVMRLAASVERASEHPLAKAIIDAAEKDSRAEARPTNVRTTVGHGVSGNVDGHAVSVGRGENDARVFVTIDGKLAAKIAFADPIKSTTADALRALHARQMQVVMVTGDARATAQSVAKELGIDRVEAEVLPAQKEEIVRRLQSEGHRVAMAGDGVNDAPALARADTGIAMGSGTDVAIESAGVTLVKGDLRGIVRARVLAEAMMRNVKQNLFFAFVYNIIGVPVAAFGLLNPMIASAAMTVSSVTVIANALRLRRVQL